MNHSFKNAILAILFLSATFSFAFSPAYQGFDESYVSLGDLSKGKQEITIEVDDAPFHFRLTAKLDAEDATENIAMSLDEIEFAVGYVDKTLKIKGKKRVIEYVDLMVLWENEPVTVKDAEFTLLPPVSQDPKAMKALGHHSKQITNYNKMPAAKKYSQNEVLIDDAVTGAWNKGSRPSNSGISAASVSNSVSSPAPTNSSNNAMDDELKRKLEAAKQANKMGRIDPPAVAAAKAMQPQAQPMNEIMTSGDHVVRDGSTRKIIGFSLLATGVITGLQTIMLHQMQATHTANVQNYEDIYLAEISREGGDNAIFITKVKENEEALKSKAEANRNLAGVVAILSLIGGTFVLNF